MKNLIIALLLSSFCGVFVGCQTKEDKVKETVEKQLYKNMKNPESLKILSCIVRYDTVPFYLTEDILDLANKYREAIEEYSRYDKMGYLWANEKYESFKKASEAKKNFEVAYNIAKENDPKDVEIMAYVKSSGTNPMGGVVSSSTIFIIDKTEPEKIIGSFTVDYDFIALFAGIKVVGENYEFKKNRFGKYETSDLPYVEQFILNDVE